MNNVFAPDYPRDSEDRVLFPRDTNLRASLFPLTDPSEHIAKAQMLMVKSIVEYVSEPGETILDPFGGTGTILVAVTIARKVIMFEIEEHFQKVIEQNIKGLKMSFPDADEFTNLIPGDCSKILPVPDFCDHAIFSPPYSNVLKKKGTMDKASVDLGYGSGTLYTADPENIGNMSDFMYYQKMEKVYTKLFQSIKKGGTITIIIKDRMEAGRRIYLGKRALRDCERIGWKLVAWNKWYARGGGYAAVNRSHGLETVDTEDLITLRRP